MADSGLKRMWNFSLVQRMQISITGLNVGLFVFKNFQDKVGLFPVSFSLRKWVDKVVLFWGEGVSMLALCLLNLDLNFFANPTYVWTFFPPSEVTVAW